MGTFMHRLQISLPPVEMQFLKARAQRDGLSIAEVIRQLVRREAEVEAARTTVQSVWDIAGIAQDNQPLLQDVAVSERPELYLAALATAPRKHRRGVQRAAPRRKQSKK